MSNTNKHYLDNKEFEATIKLYLENPSEHEARLMELLDILIGNIIKSFKFVNVDYDDAKQECFLLCIKTLKNFTPEKGSAFNYFTTVILNNLKLIYTKNKRYNDKLSEYRETRGDVFTDKSSRPPDQE